MEDKVKNLIGKWRGKVAELTDIIERSYQKKEDTSQRMYLKGTVRQLADDANELEVILNEASVAKAKPLSCGNACDFPRCTLPGCMEKAKTGSEWF